MIFKTIHVKSILKIAILFLIPILVAACGGESAEQTLTGTQWQWHAVVESEVETVVPNPEGYTINFAEDGSVSIKADCNLAGATYTLDGDVLTIAPGPTTLAYCGDESLDQVFLTFLNRVNGYRIKNSSLTLVLTDGAGEMSFKAE